MSEILDRIRALIATGQVRISQHGYNALDEDGLTPIEVVQGAAEAVIVEEYPDFRKGPCVLVRQSDSAGRFIHALWGTYKDQAGSAVLITAYRPNPLWWSDDFLRRNS